MKLALGQINPTVGDFAGNAGCMMDYARRAVEGGAKLAIFPELALSGYPPQDLVEAPSYLDQNESALQRLATEAADLGVDIICGFVGRADREGPQKAANCAAYLSQGPGRFRAAKVTAPHLRRLRRMALLRSR